METWFSQKTVGAAVDPSWVWICHMSPTPHPPLTPMSQAPIHHTTFYFHDGSVIFIVSVSYSFNKILTHCGTLWTDWKCVVQTGTCLFLSCILSYSETCFLCQKIMNPWLQRRVWVMITLSCCMPPSLLLNLITCWHGFTGESFLSTYITDCIEISD